MKTSNGKKLKNPMAMAYLKNSLKYILKTMDPPVARCLSNICEKGGSILMIIDKKWQQGLQIACAVARLCGGNSYE